MDIRFVKISKSKMEDLVEYLIHETKNFEFEDWSRDNFLLDLPGKWESSLFIYINDQFAGFSINSLKCKSIHIHYFFIIRKFRNFGVGKLLLAECISLVQKRNLQKLVLKCHVKNFKALEFYIRNSLAITNLDESRTYYTLELKIKEMN
ncbi:MAG: GNAT family N-acetyltransferase [Candidatus Atribacteria bacterium]|nr:GNAT family N-acetyltransferase [Candidatus Atribacteria bacterium]